MKVFMFADAFSFPDGIVADAAPQRCAMAEY